mmetsp:Transcript_12310/g.16613  ORF Transcript_12310/g.16613 Transcript_12310/m.16613 type:complete len:194 (+) Transcript_12310:434-1015(+)
MMTRITNNKSGDAQALTLPRGIFPFDGSSSLEALWMQFKWKPIRGCDGRFILRGLRLRPEAISSYKNIVRLRPVSEEVDGIIATRLRGGGGLLSYEKKDGTFIHTLNTESGLCRKLTALDLFEQFCKKATFFTTRDRHLFITLDTVLRFFPDPERTRLGPHVSAIVRIRLALAPAVLHSLRSSSSRNSSIDRR